MDPWSNTTTDTGNYPYLSLSCHRSEVSVLLGSPLPVPGIKLNNNTRKKRKKVTRWFEKKKNIYSRTRDVPIFSFFGLGSMSPPSFWLRILGVFATSRLYSAFLCWTTYICHRPYYDNNNIVDYYCIYHHVVLFLTIFCADGLLYCEWIFTEKRLRSNEELKLKLVCILVNTIFNYSWKLFIFIIGLERIIGLEKIRI